MISRELEVEILRLHRAEHWKIGTIAAQLHTHHSTVRRVLMQAGLVQAPALPRASMVDPYKGFILETLTKYPTLRASRLYAMIRERGYRGSATHFRHRVALLRPRPPAEAYLRLRMLPGETGQIDWAHFGHIQVGRAKRPLMAFVMVLAYSRMIFLRFYLGAAMGEFIRGHVEGFERLGVARVLFYDNLKSAVLERVGQAIHFNPNLLELAAHYQFQPRPVAVARGNEKGRVERAIRYARDSFFAARTYTDIDDLNAQADAWCLGEAADRPCPEDRSRTVREVWAPGFDSYGCNVLISLCTISKRAPTRGSIARRRWGGGSPELSGPAFDLRPAWRRHSGWPCRPAGPGDAECVAVATVPALG